MARLSRSKTRRRRSRRANQHRLGGIPARADLAPADRTGLVLFAVRGDGYIRRNSVATDEMWRLPQEHRRTGMAASRCREVLGIERRRRPARHADGERRASLRVRRDRDSERARRRHPVRWSGRASRGTTPAGKVPDSGFASSPVGRRRRCRRRGVRHTRRVQPGHRQAALGRAAACAGATVRPNARRSTVSRKC